MMLFSKSLSTVLFSQLCFTQLMLQQCSGVYYAAQRIPHVTVHVRIHYDMDGVACYTV